MVLRFTGGGYWNGVQFECAHAPQEVRLGGVFVHDQQDQQAVPEAMQKTVLMSKVEHQRYEFDRFEGPDEDVAIYRFVP